MRCFDHWFMIVAGTFQLTEMWRLGTIQLAPPFLTHSNIFRRVGRVLEIEMPTWSYNLVKEGANAVASS
jgi:hypothetical protein